jgi:S-adenosylmethionine decarboxylase
VLDPPRRPHRQSRGYAPGARHLGRHLIAEFWGGQGLANPDFLKSLLITAAASSGATVIDTKIHHFGEEQGVTGVALLAESHISIHTWPEHGYSAIDVFMCGEADPHVAVETMRRVIEPKLVQLIEHHRGVRQSSAPGEGLSGATSHDR